MNDKNEKKINEEELPEVVMVKHRRFSLIWIIPIIAAGIGVWLLLTAIVQSGIPITITFKNGANVDSKTLIKYEGVVVGNVSSVKLNKDLDGVTVKASLNRSAKGLASEGSLFWVVRPQISYSGITGLETLISGSYIGVKPGKGAKTKIFKGVEEPPVENLDEGGLKIILRSDKLGSLHPGAPVYYREIKVGEVTSYKMEGNSQSVILYVNILKQYVPLIHENTKFWNASGIGMSLSLFGAKVKTESLESILTGGIAFATPNNDKMGALSKDNDVFALYDEPKKEWLKWQPDISINGEGISEEKIETVDKDKGETDQQSQSAKEKDKRNYDF